MSLNWDVTKVANYKENFPDAGTPFQNKAKTHLQTSATCTQAACCDATTGFSMSRKQMTLDLRQVTCKKCLATPEAAKASMRSRMVICDEVQTPHSYAVCSCTTGHTNPRLSD
jgi:hypothetical protein